MKSTTRPIVDRDLKPSNLTDEQRELVERVRANMAKAQQAGIEKARSRKYQQVYNPRGARAAAIDAHHQNLTYAEAGRRHGVSGEAVRKWWRKLFPDEERSRGPKAGRSP